MDKFKIPSYSISQESFPSSQYNLIQFMKKYDIDTLQKLLVRSVEEPEWFWNAVNKDLDIRWKIPFKKVVDCSKGLPWCDWFVSGKCNIIDNVLTKNVEKNPSKTAFIFVNRLGQIKQISFKNLKHKVDEFAITLATLGVKKGDVVGIYLPMKLESFVALYACSKLGAVHVPIFSGYGKKALEQRLVDSKSSYLITSDSFFRRGKKINLKEHWGNVLISTLVKKIILLDDDDDEDEKYVKNCLRILDHGGILSYENILSDSNFHNFKLESESEVMDSSDPLFILYTSGTTGKPKGTIQTHGGFSIFAAHQSSYLIDLKPSDVLFWYADMGWITGQTWIVYGSPIIGSTAVVFEDVLDYPQIDFWARIIDELGVTIFGVAPTAIRQMIKNNVDLSNYSFDSLRILVSTGERLNKDAWIWYNDNIGKGKCPVINLSGGTEIGGAILSMLPFLNNVPTSVGVPVPGLDVDILNDSGETTNNGYLVIRNSWPAMTRGLLHDDVKYLQTYWSKFTNVWYHGDRVYMDEKKMWYLTGREDDVIKVSGHRVDPGELEEVLTDYEDVIEAAVVGIPDDVLGESLCVLCVLKKNGITSPHDKLRVTLEQILMKSFGKFILPRYIFFVEELPKSRSGKILRRLIRAKLLGNEILREDLLIVENHGSLNAIEKLGSS